MGSIFDAGMKSVIPLSVLARAGLCLISLLGFGGGVVLVAGSILPFSRPVFCGAVAAGGRLCGF